MGEEPIAYLPRGATADAIAKDAERPPATGRKTGKAEVRAVIDDHQKT
jgi:hypothetical protein